MIFPVYVPSLGSQSTFPIYVPSLRYWYTFPVYVPGLGSQSRFRSTFPVYVRYPVTYLYVFFYLDNICINDIPSLRPQSRFPVYVPGLRSESTLLVYVPSLRSRSMYVTLLPTYMFFFILMFNII